MPFFCYSLAKEKVYYMEEADEMLIKIDKMKSDGKDEYDIRKQVGTICNTSLDGSF